MNDDRLDVPPPGPGGVRVGFDDRARSDNHTSAINVAASARMIATSPRMTSIRGDSVISMGATDNMDIRA